MFLKKFVQEAITEYRNHNQGTLPGYIIVYRDGVGGPTFEQKILESEIFEVQAAVEGV